MDIKQLFLQALATCIIVGVCCEEKCKAGIKNPDDFDVCSTYNSGITVKFSENDISPKTCGSSWSPKAASEVPIIKWPGAIATNYYTILMVDPDAPSKSNPSMRYWLHWIVTGVTGDVLSGKQRVSGTESIPYQGPSPPAKKGPHRYQIFIFQSSHDAPLSGFPQGKKDRAKFNVNDFIKINKFCDSLVAAFQFTAENKG